MTIANISDPSAMNGAQVHGSDGDKLGKVDAVYYDNDTEQPEWVAMKSGLFGGHVSLVPLGQGNWDGNTPDRAVRPGHDQGRAAPRPRRRAVADRRGATSTATTA